MSLEESEIIERVLRGERDEYRHLVRACQNRVFSIVMRQVGDAEVAREIAQETFLKGFVKLSSFRGQSSFSTWITRIALNLTNNYFASRSYREHSRQRALNESDFALPDDAESSEIEVSINKLERAVGRLPSEHREILVLVALERRSYEEAAEILEIPVGTVRSRLHKARALLREEFFKV